MVDRAAQANRRDGFQQREETRRRRVERRQRSLRSVEVSPDLHGKRNQLTAILARGEVDGAVQRKDRVSRNDSAKKAV